MSLYHSPAKKASAEEKIINIAIYARYSCHNQTEQSIEGQLEVCHDYAAKHDYHIVAEYIDRALSGTSDDRPQFLQMIDDSSKGGFDFVLVYQLDRFSRNRYDSAIYKKKLEKNGVRVLSARENITDDASGVLIESVLEGMAEYYSVELAQKVRRGMKLNAEKCLVTGGQIPLGYKIGPDHKYVVDEAAAPIVREIFTRYANGEKAVSICKDLNLKGLHTSSGANFSRTSLHTIFSNRRYLGEYRYGDIVVPGGIPRLIDDALFARVQQRIGENRIMPAHTKAKEEYLLSGKLFCGHCGSTMIGYGGTGKSGRVYHYYACSGLRRGCSKKAVAKSKIEKLVVDECRALLTDENIEKIAQATVEYFNRQKTGVSRLDDLQKAREECDRKTKNLFDAVAECSIPSIRQSLYTQIEAQNQQSAQIDEDIRSEKANSFEVSKKSIIFFLRSVRRESDSSTESSKMLIKALVKKIVLYDDKLVITHNLGLRDVSVSLGKEEDSGGGEGEKCSFLKLIGPPFQPNTNTSFIGSLLEVTLVLA